MSSLIGRVVLSRYRVLHLLGKGGMGEVYLARSEGTAGFHRPVVVKRLLAQHQGDAQLVSLFEREARIMSTLRHPHIVSVLDFGRDGDDEVMVIEYVHGFHLGRWVRFLEDHGERFPVERAIQIVLDVLAALDHAHNARTADGSPLSIVHRDVSPANVLIDVEGTVKLADFGIARMEGENTVSEGSQHAAVKGKFPYMPPEIFDGRTATAQSDVYAAAVVLDEILRGRNAFRAGNMAETLAHVLEHEPDPLDTLRDDVSHDLARLVSRSMAKDPKKRPRSAAELATELRKLRRTGPDAARAELSAATHRDFLDRDLARSLALPSLPELEAMWTSSAPTVPEPQDDAPRNSTMPTRVAPLAPSRTPSPPARPWAAITAAVLAVVGVIAGVWWATRSSPPPAAPVFVVIEHGAPDAPPPAASATPTDVPAVPADAGLRPAPLDAGRPGPVGDRPRPIEAPFRARSREISRCYTDHVAAVAGTPEIVVRFVVRAGGTVERVTVTPPEIGSSALGRCIAGIAESTRFDTAAPITFSVPLGARRAP